MAASPAAPPGSLVTLPWRSTGRVLHAHQARPRAAFAQSTPRCAAWYVLSVYHHRVQPGQPATKRMVLHGLWPDFGSLYEQDPLPPKYDGQYQVRHDMLLSLDSCSVHPSTGLAAVLQRRQRQLLAMRGHRRPVHVVQCHQQQHVKAGRLRDMPARAQPVAVPRARQHHPSAAPAV